MKPLTSHWYIGYSFINVNGENSTREQNLKSDDYDEMLNEVRKFKKLSKELQGLETDMCVLGTKRNNLFQT